MSEPGGDEQAQEGTVADDPKRVLVVDDDDGVREIVQISLEATANWTVLLADSGTAALAIARAEQPDAILLDVMMPDLDGVETFRQLAAQPETRGIPTILLTAKAKMSERRALADLGVAGVIVKPFQAMSLAKQISTMLGWSAA